MITFNDSAPLTAEELAVILNISEFTVKELARKGELPCTYVNRRPMFNLSAILELFEKIERAA